MSRGRKIIKVGLITIICLCIAGYALYQARKVIEGPQIIVDSPMDGQTISSPDLEIRGRAKNIAFLYLNNKKIFTNDAGIFIENTVISLGINVLELRADDKFGNEIFQRITVFRNK